MENVQNSPHTVQFWLLRWPKWENNLIKLTKILDGEVNIEKGWQY